MKQFGEEKRLYSRPVSLESEQMRLNNKIER
jgi:hypothetical protein